MKWQPRALLLVGLIAFLTPSAVLAQGASVGSITGVVKDESGAVLPGVTVEASSPALIEKLRTTTTDDQGQYTIIQLPPGPYTVTFTLAGFSTFRREGIVLTTNFSANVPATLGVGALEESVTVSGASPLVDIRNVSQQKTISSEILDAVPTSKTMLAMAALVPAATMAPAAQDVGGSRGEATTRISIHGSKPAASTLLLDGLSYNRTTAATGRSFMINPLSAQEVVMDLGAGGSAEYSSPGVALNLVPRDGANKYSSTIFAAGTNKSLQGDNLTDDLKAQGLKTVNRMNTIYDLNVFIGGPVKQDKLWFSSSHRRWGRNEQIANLFLDANPNDFLFTPDLNRPVQAREDLHHHDLRFTWQAAEKHKFSGGFYYQIDNQADNFNTLSPGTRALEANQQWCQRVKIWQTAWTHPHSNRLLFESGFLMQFDDSDKWKNPCVGDVDKVQIRDAGTNFLYNGQGVKSRTYARMNNERFSMSYLTGDHNFKVGVRIFNNLLFQKENYTERNPGPIFLPVAYTFTNGVATGLTQYASPLAGSFNRHVTMGIFGQDQWQLNRLTVTAGIRYEYVNGWAPPVSQLGGLLVDAASFPGASCLPCWHDINPRVGGSFDVFGNGKTAVKASIGRYVELMNTQLADQFAPWVAVVNSTTRSWTDRNGNNYPDCNLRDPEISGECQAMANKSFGKPFSNTTPDPDWINGWGNRGYTWMSSFSVDHELRPGIALNAGYYRTWSGNYTVTDNLEVTPQDYDPYCITAPTDSRLKSGVSGKQICGFYDVKPAKFGLVRNRITLADNFGNQTEIYNGADAQFTARLPRGAQVAGGWNVGNTVSTFVAYPGDTQARTNNCFVVDSPQQLYNCESSNPYRHQFRMNGTATVPGQVKVAVVYQNLPGTNETATYTVGTADIAKTLGRDLAGGTRNVTLELYPIFANFHEGRIHQVDARFSRQFRVGAARVQGNFDIYNVLNNAAVLQVRGQYNATWLQPTQILNARMLKFGFQIDF